MRQIKVVLGCGGVLTFLCFLAVFFWPKPDIHAQWASVRSAVLSDGSLALLTDDRTANRRLYAGAPRPDFVSVNGVVAGPSPQDFKRFAWLGNLFSLELVDGEGVHWRSQPGDIDVTRDRKYSFDVPIMIPRSCPPGAKELVCRFRGNTTFEVARIEVDVAQYAAPKTQ